MTMVTSIGRVFLLAPVLFLAAAAAQAQTLQADFSVLHALHQWNTTGLSADLGGSLNGRHFLGLEYTRFSPKFTYSYPIYGSAQVDEKIETLQLAYRYSIPLGFSGGDARYTPLELYLGGAGGFGRVRQTLTYFSAIVPGAGPQPAAQEIDLCWEAVAGLQYNFGPNFGFRAGFRYIDSVNNVKLFNADANTDTKALEAGIVVRF
jgi:hypothetical protein